MRRGSPLPLHPAGSVSVGEGVDLIEDDEGGAVFLWGMAGWCWEAGDVVARRLAAVSLVATGAATQVEVAGAFGTTDVTLRRWVRSWEAGGTEALRPEQRGPRRASKLTPDKREEIRAARAKGASMEEVAAITGVSLNSVSRALRGDDPARRGPAPPPPASTGLTPLARPEPRVAERSAARAGLLAGATPRFTPGASQPGAGALLVLPALAATGLIDAAARLYASGRAAFYGLSSLFLTVVFSALGGEPRAEGLTRTDPVALGRLLGLDRAPEVATLRRRLQSLAALGRSGELVRALAEAHLGSRPQLDGVFYLDGHVRAYHGSARLPKVHLARARLAMPGVVDTWVTDARGDGLLVWSSPPGAALSSELRSAVAEIRSLVGPDARPTVAFDRGGWSPATFAQLIAQGFHILTYRKGKASKEPRSAFVAYEHRDDLGRAHTYHLSDRRVRLAWKQGRANKRVELRQVTRLDPKSGHQTQVLTSRADLSAPEVAQAMFSRWRIENFFRYMRSHLALDALDSYAKVADDDARSVPNPARAAQRNQLSKARAAQGEAEAALAEAISRGEDPASGTLEEANAFLDRARDGLREAKVEVGRHEEALAGIPTRVALGELHPDAELPHPERKTIMDAIRMATYNAESATVRLLAPHYARAEDEARSLVREAYGASADLEVVGDCLHVRIDPLSAPRRSRAIAGLCEELNATETTYPGTKLRLVYSIKHP